MFAFHAHTRILQRLASGEVRGGGVHHQRIAGFDGALDTLFGLGMVHRYCADYKEAAGCACFSPRLERSFP